MKNGVAIRGRKTDVRNSFEDTFQIDFEMWKTGEEGDTRELAASMERYAGLITFKDRTTGVVLAQGCYDKGQPVGLWSFWHDNGQLAKQYVFAPDCIVERPRGMIMEWYRDGQTALEGYYQRNGIGGVWRGWKENGELSREVDVLKDHQFRFYLWDMDDDYNMKDGYRRFLRFHETPEKTIQEGYCKDNHRQGWWKWYHPNGRIASLTYFKDGLPDGCCFIIDPWLLRTVNPEFGEFCNRLGCRPYLVYFRKGVAVTGEKYILL